MKRSRVKCSSTVLIGPTLAQDKAVYNNILYIILITLPWSEGRARREEGAR